MEEHLKIKYVIFGGGYIGTELYYFFKSLSNNVIWITRKEHDLEEPFEDKTIFSNEECVFINCAATVQTLSKDESIIERNLKIVQNELELVKPNDIFIQISTYSVNVNSIYGKSKKICDDYLMEHNKNNNFYCFRIMYPFGIIHSCPRNGIVGSIYKNESLILYKQALKNVSIYCYIGDILKIIELISKREIKESIIYCPGYKMSLEFFIKLYEKYNGTLLKTIIDKPEYKPTNIDDIEYQWYGIERTDIERMFRNLF